MAIYGKTVRALRAFTRSTLNREPDWRHPRPELTPAGLFTRGAQGHEVLVVLVELNSVAFGFEGQIPGSDGHGSSVLLNSHHRRHGRRLLRLDGEHLICPADGEDFGHGSSWMAQRHLHPLQ